MHFEAIFAFYLDIKYVKDKQDILMYLYEYLYDLFEIICSVIGLFRLFCGGFWFSFKLFFLTMKTRNAPSPASGSCISFIMKFTLDIFISKWSK